jgi:hypothetical protein
MHRRKEESQADFSRELSLVVLASDLPPTDNYG